MTGASAPYGPAGDGLTPDGLLTTTRSVRRRLDLGRPVPVALVGECLRIAQQAPCGSGRNAGHWIVVSDPATRAAIGELYRRAFDRYVSSPASPKPAGQAAGPGPGPAGGENPREASRRRSLDSAGHLARHLGEVPVLVMACLDSGGPLPGGSQAGLWGSLMPSVWSYMLAARARGLGTAWTTAHLAYEREIAELLGIPPGVHQGALIPTAYYLGDTFRPAARPPLQGVLHHDRW
ncbi:nitroreductase family protein [Planobispora takensis]|uniref:Oxidoreductase n=1 Tax=Planobispora takensis TaxID=1367882 RepID=A0A8J3T215_9ACTN|nr:nitroreductase family protein [Planobispora takensis]GII04652.1 oxidoreductase [Planobispora takensis]